MAVSVLTQHNDNKRSGANLNETILNTSNVNVNQFGLIAARQVTGQIYAQPLYVPGVAGAGGRNLVIVATMENWVYAFDADDLSKNANPVWQRQVDPHPVAARLFNQAKRRYLDIAGNIGILSTPAIDQATGTLYLVAATADPALLDGPNIQQAFKHLLFALDVGTGALKPAAPGSTNPVAITGSVPGLGYHDASGDEINPGVKVHKNAAGAVVTMHVNAKDVDVTDSANSQVHFNPMQQMNRPGLLLENHLLYIAFGSHGDFDPYHGWVFAYEADTLKPRGVFCTTPGGAKAGIWQAGEGLVSDGSGNVYCGTGNGDTKPNALGGPDLGESYFRLRADTATLHLNGFVSPFKDVPHGDEDLGAASPTVLPDGFLVGGGKDGNFYLLDPSRIDNTGSATAVVQQFMATLGPGSRQTNTHHIHGSPVVYDSPEHGVIVYVWGENDLLRGYHYDPTAHTFPDQPNQRDTPLSAPLAHGVLYASNDMPNRDGMPGGMLSISADGKTPGSAIVWASLPPFGNANNATVRGELVAYAASQIDSQNRLVQLWRSHQNPAVDENPDVATTFAKFCCPTIADGKVFLATFSNTLRIYGLRQTPDGGYNVGFGGKTGLTLNGSARAADNARLRLAGQHSLQAGSVFSTTPVGVARFTCTFRMRMWTDAGAQSADGMTFCIQNEGARALGGPGGGLGYGPDALDPHDPAFIIHKSVAIKFDLIDDHVQPRSLIGVYQGGATPNTANAIGGEVAVDQGPNALNFHSGHNFDVQLDYDGTTLTVRIRDADDAAHPQVVHGFPVNIPGIVEGANAHVGFTAGTGGLSANLDILSWQFTSH